MLKTWNMWLIFSTFGLSIFGTFLTRSGVVSSVHAFAQSSIGDWFVAFLGIDPGGLPLLLCQEPLAPAQRTQTGIAGFARVEFPVQQSAVCWWPASRCCGEPCFPVLSEWVQGHKVTVGPPFFNRVNIPVALLLLLLTARRSAAGLAQDFTREPEAQFSMAGAGRAGGRASLLARELGRVGPGRTLPISTR